MLLACGSGYQAALLVPTEILAEQHYLNLQQYVANLGLNMALVTGGLSKKSGRECINRSQKEKFN